MRAILIAALLLALATVSAPAATEKPTLLVVDSTPLTVRGAYFGARELVVVTVKREDRLLARRSVRTGATGRFSVTFTGTFIGTGADRCSFADTTTIVARSASGVAVAKAPVPKTLCPPPLGPR
jgi:hypothetical protein